MSKKSSQAPLPMTSRDIKQDMVGLLTQSCQMDPERALKQARFFGKWIFLVESPKDRALRWWAVKCAIISRSKIHFDGGAIIQHAGAILDFLDEDVDEDADAEAEAV